MLTLYQKLTIVLWIAHEVLWGILARGNKKDAIRAKSFPRALSLLALFLGFVLIYSPFLSVGILGIQLLPKDEYSGIAGVVICVSGLLFAWRARGLLGKNWSGAVTLKIDHELIREGPYAIVRHPIYTGLLFAMLGSAVAMTELKGLVAVALVFWGLLQKIRGEEVLLESHFSEYREYTLRVKKLIPFLY